MSKFEALFPYTVSSTQKASVIPQHHSF